MEDMPFDPPEVQFGEAARSPLDRARGLVPDGRQQRHHGISRASDTMSPPDSQFRSEIRTTPPPLRPRGSRLLPTRQHPADGEPPRSTVPESPAAAPDGELAAATSRAALGHARSHRGDPRLQHNPFVNENVRVRPADAAARANGEQIGVRAYERARKLAKLLVDEGKYHEALATLSVFYQSQDLTPEEHRELVDLLDPLAGRVIYSREHLVEPAYGVRRNETLTEIAQRYNVPMELLQKINGIDNPERARAGHRSEGRHRSVPGRSGPRQSGADAVPQRTLCRTVPDYGGAGSGHRFWATSRSVEKREDRDYFSIDGRKIAAGNPANPFGNVWLDLGREVCHSRQSDWAAPIRNAAASASAPKMRTMCTASCRLVRRSVFLR